MGGDRETHDAARSSFAGPRIAQARDCWTKWTGTRRKSRQESRAGGVAWHRARIVPPSVVPPLRVRAVNRAAIRADGRYVLYWMIAARRVHDNFGLDRALEHARRLGKPLNVLEALRVGYPYASDRFHRFVIDGMAEHALAFEQAGIAYHPYVEPEVGAGSGLLEALGKDAGRGRH